MKKTTSLLVAVCTAVAMVGCDNSSSSGPALSSSSIRAIHASPNAPDVDVYVDGELAVEDLTFGATSAQTELAPGAHRIDLRVADSDPATAPVLGIDVNLAPGSASNVVATNTLENLELRIFDASQSAPEPQSSRVTFIHSSPDAPTVDITRADGSTLFDDVSFGDSSGPLEVPAGMYSLQVRDETGTVVVLDLPLLTLEDGANYSVLAIGFFAGEPDQPGLSALVVSDVEPLRARLRVGHLSPDAPNVDVCLDGMLVVENVPFTGISDYWTVREGAHQLKVVGAGSNCDSDGVIDVEVILAPDTEYSALATDVFAEIAPLVVVDDNSEVPMDMARLAFVHTSPDAPTVDITLTDGTTLFDDVAFGGAPEAIEVPVGTYTIQVRDMTGEAIVLTVENLTLNGGGSYTAFATGLLDGMPDLGALLIQNN